MKSISIIILLVTALASAKSFLPPLTPFPTSPGALPSAGVDSKFEEQRHRPHKVIRTVTITKTICPIEITRFPTPPGQGGEEKQWVFIGCLGSNNGHTDFTLQSTSPQMDPAECQSDCEAANLPFAGLYLDQCYCADTLHDENSNTDQANGKCDIECPGNPLETCGGNEVAPPLQKVRALSNGVLLSVYELFINGVPEGDDGGLGGPQSSMGSDPPMVPRGIDADMERGRRSPQPNQLMHGGVLRSSKRTDGNVVVKRDFAIKQLFGL